MGGAGCVRGREKEWMGCFLDDLIAFGIDADQSMDDYYYILQSRTRGNGARQQNKGRDVSWRNGSIAAEKVRAGLRHAVVCPNVAGRTKERIAEASAFGLIRSP